MKHTLILFAFVTLISSGYAQVPEYVPVDGLLGWYPFNGNAQDESGNEKHGQSDGAVLASDRFEAESSAFMFDGSSSIVLPDVEVSNSFSSSFWLLADASSDQSDAVVDGSSGNFIRIVNEVDESWQFGANSICSGNPYSQDGFALGDWVHGAVVFDGDSISFFLNGTFTNSLPDCSDYWKLQFIGFADNGSHGFDGIIDDVGFWNRGLTVEEISTLYNWTPFGCANYGACNYDSMATIDDGSCDYSCCPGPGCCDIGMHWDWELGMCQITNVADTNLDGCVQLNDLLDVLSAYGDCGVLENEVQVISNPNFEIADGIYNQWPELTIALRAAFSDSTGSSNIYRQIEGGEMGLNHSDGKLSFSLKASNGNCFTAAGWVAVETDLTDDDLHSIIARYSRLTGEFSLAIDGEIMVVSAINSGDLADCNLYNGEIGFPSNKAWSLEEIGFYDFVWSEEMVASYADCVPLTSLDMESAQLILPSGVSIDEVEELLSPYAPITVTGTSGFLPCE